MIARPRRRRCRRPGREVGGQPHVGARRGAIRDERRAARSPRWRRPARSPRSRRRSAGAASAVPGKRGQARRATGPPARAGQAVGRPASAPCAIRSSAAHERRRSVRARLRSANARSWLSVGGEVGLRVERRVGATPASARARSNAARRSRWKSESGAPPMKPMRRWPRSSSRRIAARSGRRRRS